MTAASAIHLEAGGRPRCGCRHPSCLTRYEEAVTCGICLNLMRGGNTLGLRHPDWQLRPHGTAAAYKRHYRRGEKPCESCRQYEERRRERDRRGNHHRRAA